MLIPFFHPDEIIKLSMVNKKSHYVLQKVNFTMILLIQTGNQNIKEILAFCNQLPKKDQICRSLINFPRFQHNFHKQLLTKQAVSRLQKELSCPPLMNQIDNLAI